MNKTGQATQMIGLIGSLFVSLILYFLLLTPLISPVIEIAVASVDSVGLQILIKFIPFGVIFGFVLFLVQTFTGRR